MLMECRTAIGRAFFELSCSATNRLAFRKRRSHADPETNLFGCQTGPAICSLVERNLASKGLIYRGEERSCRVLAAVERKNLTLWAHEYWTKPR